jgi:hypothetical protein
MPHCIGALFFFRCPGKGLGKGLVDICERSIQIFLLLLCKALRKFLLFYCKFLLTLILMLQIVLLLFHKLPLLFQKFFLQFRKLHCKLLFTLVLMPQIFLLLLHKLHLEGITLIPQESPTKQDEDRHHSPLAARK